MKRIIASFLAAVAVFLPAVPAMAYSFQIHENRTGIVKMLTESASGAWLVNDRIVEVSTNRTDPTNPIFEKARYTSIRGIVLDMACTLVGMYCDAE